MASYTSTAVSTHISSTDTIAPMISASVRGGNRERKERGGGGGGGGGEGHRERA